MMRATIIALIVLSWWDELTTNGQYTHAALETSRAVAHAIFGV